MNYSSYVFNLECRLTDGLKQCASNHNFIINARIILLKFISQYRQSRNVRVPLLRIIRFMIFMQKTMRKYRNLYMKQTGILNI
jgi:hypothetical protein